MNLPSRTRSEKSSIMKSFFLQIIAVVVLLLLQHTEPCLATKKPDPCPPSHCGNITNIKPPFRLKGDPATCGHPEYELTCENNRTLLLPLFPGENYYHVKAINYNNFTVRVVDPGIEEANCSSFPRHFLSAPNFTSSYDLNNHTADPYEAVRFTLVDDISASFAYIPMFQHVIYMNCSNPVKEDGDSVYVDTAPCGGGGGGDRHSHVYAVAGDMEIKDLKDGCRVKFVTPISYFGYDYDTGEWVKPRRTFSYGEIHEMLVSGFEVSWMRRPCLDHCGKPGCFYSRTTEGVECNSLRLCTTPLGFHARCGILSKERLFVEDILFGIAQGLLEAMKKTVYEKYWLDTHSKLGLKIGRVTGKYVLPSYIIMRFIIGFILLVGKLVHTYRRRHTSIYENIEDFLQGNSIVPIRYSYKEIKQMARGFKDKLGEGGYGLVYKGKLRSGPLVAIKMLNKPKADGQEFISEVATIGRIHHANVVKLIGYCFETSKHVLVYEFMPNGSLDRYISSKDDDVSLTYNQMYAISLGVARGIAYLHQGCDMQILHFDIKPHNILLDENFNPKVSDFGLARLYPIDNSIVTLTAARGTIGYMAPELFYNNIGRVSYKADVYSFGMLLMEMANRRRNLNPYADRSSQFFFPYWIHHQLIEEREIEMGEATDEERNSVKKMFIVALWCIQLKPDDRPSMTKVIEMLEGDVENIPMPPTPSPYPSDIEIISSDESSSSNAFDSMCFDNGTIEDPLLKDSF